MRIHTCLSSTRSIIPLRIIRMPSSSHSQTTTNPGYRGVAAVLFQVSRWCVSTSMTGWLVGNKNTVLTYWVSRSGSDSWSTMLTVCSRQMTISSDFKLTWKPKGIQKYKAISTCTNCNMQCSVYTVQYCYYCDKSRFVWPVALLYTFDRYTHYIT